MNDYTNRRCFLLATGSSINEQNLELLKNEYCIATSRFFKHPLFNIIQPQFYVMSSGFTHMAAHGYDFILQTFKRVDNAISYDEITILCDIQDQPMIEEHNLFHNKKVEYYTLSRQEFPTEISEVSLDSITSFYAVSELMIQYALILNFKEIFIIGLDHDWFVDLHQYFYEKKEDSKELNKKGDDIYKKIHTSEFQMIRHSIIFNRYKKLFSLKKNIFNANANKNSYVDVFPKVSYEDLFKIEQQSINIDYSIDDNIDSAEHLKLLLTNDKKVLVRFIALILEQIQNLEKNTTFVVYGYGTIGKLIEILIPSKDLLFIDKNCFDNPKVRQVDEIRIMEYDYILISAIGYEDAIKKDLISNYGIDSRKIKTFNL